MKNSNGVKIIYTRKTDVFIELWKRADIANKADADLFVSIHCNSVNNPSPYGTETWVLGENNSARNFEFAKRENEVIFLEENYEENYAGYAKWKNLKGSDSNKTVQFDSFHQWAFTYESLILLVQNLQRYYLISYFPHRLFQNDINQPQLYPQP